MKSLFALAVVAAYVQVALAQGTDNQLTLKKVEHYCQHISMALNLRAVLPPNADLDDYEADISKATRDFEQAQNDFCQAPSPTPKQLDNVILLSLYNCRFGCDVAFVSRSDLAKTCKFTCSHIDGQIQDGFKTIEAQNK